MECVNSYSICILSDHRSETRSHILGGILGEGEAKDIGWEVVGCRKDIGYTCSKYLRLAASRSGDH